MSDRVLEGIKKRHNNVHARNAAETRMNMDGVVRGKHNVDVYGHWQPFRVVLSIRASMFDLKSYDATYWIRASNAQDAGAAAFALWKEWEKQEFMGLSDLESRNPIPENKIDVFPVSKQDMRAAWKEAKKWLFRGKGEDHLPVAFAYWTQEQPYWFASPKYGLTIPRQVCRQQR